MSEQDQQDSSDTGAAVNGRRWYLWGSLVTVVLSIILIIMVVKVLPAKVTLDIALLEKMPAEQIIKDPAAVKLAISATDTLFKDKCETCHGPQGEGLIGHFPKLNDSDWLHGGSVTNIANSISDGHEGLMPAHAGTMSREDTHKLADFVINLSQGITDQKGWDLFDASGCTGCHGDDAKGNSYAGSADLTDTVWRFGGDREAVLLTIRAGTNHPGVTKTRHAVMPGWKDRLQPLEIKLLAVRVWGLARGVN